MFIYVQLNCSICTHHWGSYKILHIQLINDTAMHWQGKVSFVHSEMTMLTVTFLYIQAALRMQNQLFIDANAGILETIMQNQSSPVTNLQNLQHDKIMH